MHSAIPSTTNIPRNEQLSMPKLQRVQLMDSQRSNGMVTLPLWLLPFWCISCRPIVSWATSLFPAATETLVYSSCPSSSSLVFGCELGHTRLRLPQEQGEDPYTTLSQPFATFTDNNFGLTLSTWYIGSHFVTSTVACHVMSAKVNIQCDMIWSNTMQGYCLLC